MRQNAADEIGSGFARQFNVPRFSRV